MTWEIGDTITQAELNGVIALFCHFYQHHETFAYTPDEMELDCCKFQILNGIYSDEELIVETPLRLSITDERFPNQNYMLGISYYSYTPDTDNLLPELKREYFELDPTNPVIEFDNDVVYIMLDNWDFVTKFDKPIIEEVTG